MIKLHNIGIQVFELDINIDKISLENIFIGDNASINVKPERGTPGICGAFDLCCLPHPREFD